MSKSRDYADLKQDLDDSAFSGSYNDLDDRPTIPTNVSQLTNDANYTANAVTSVNGETGSSVSLSLNDLDDVDTSAAGTQKFLTKSGSTHLYAQPHYNYLSNRPIEDYTSSSTDITGLTGGSSFGHIWYGPSSGHQVVGLRNNDNDDSFRVISKSGNTGASGSFDRSLFSVNATGAATIYSSLTVPTLRITTGIDGLFGTINLLDNTDVTGNITVSGTVDGVDIASRDAELTTVQSDLNTAEADIDALEAKTSLTDFTNDISEVTTTTPTSGTGKPVGYVWYVI